MYTCARHRQDHQEPSLAEVGNPQWAGTALDRTRWHCKIAEILDRGPEAYEMSDSGQGERTASSMLDAQCPCPIPSARTERCEGLRMGGGRKKVPVLPAQKRRTGVFWELTPSML